MQRNWCAPRDDKKRYYGTSFLLTFPLEATYLNKTRVLCHIQTLPYTLSKQIKNIRLEIIINFNKVV